MAKDHSSKTYTEKTYKQMLEDKGLKIKDLNKKGYFTIKTKERNARDKEIQ
jgi:hypothetical protein